MVGVKTKSVLDWCHAFEGRFARTMFTPSFAVRLVRVACLFYFFIFLGLLCGCAKRAYLDPELCIYPYPSTLALSCHTPSPHTSDNQFHFTRRHRVCEAARLHFCSLGRELPRSD
ncbi:hypothetical protein L209DRAFT_412626 [Thermothelomyces heterothallicus CBS 203.75]